MVGTNLPTLTGPGRRRGAPIGRDFADRQSLATVLDSGVGLGDDHAHRGARMRAGRQGRNAGRAALGPVRRMGHAAD
jgi:hypothetical protein